MIKAIFTCNGVLFNRSIFMCAATAFLLTCSAQAQPGVFTTSHVPEIVVQKQATLLRPLPATQTLQLAIAPPLRHQAELDNLLKELYDPNSPVYHQWLSVQEFTDQFGPSAEDDEAVVQFAQAQGWKITSRAANRMLVTAEGSVADINRALRITLCEYQHPTENRTFYAPDREPSVDAPVTLGTVIGLDNLAQPYSPLRATPVVQVQTEAAAVRHGSAPDGSFLGSDMRAAYYGGTALTGAGQSIGIFAGSGYNLSDIAAYFQSANQRFDPSSIEDRAVDDAPNVCGSDCGEQELDIQQALSMAPGAKIIAYHSNKGASYASILNAMAVDNVAKQLSTSILLVGGSIASLQSQLQPFLKEFAAQGQTFFAASGDSGAYSSAHPALYPTEDPFVTAVGGTDLTTNGPGGVWQSETAWIDSSGGISTNGVAIPFYQQLPGVINSLNHGSATLRNVPDVAMESNFDNWHCTNGKPCGGGLGGTSFAAPRWAGFMTLVNEQAAQRGRPSVGFLNPLIYGLGSSWSYADHFHDIISGSNANKTASFEAVPRYDLVTGWGSPNGQAFIDFLTR